MKRIFIEREELINAYKKYKNQEVVARNFGVSVSVIRRLVNEYSLPKYNNLSRLEMPSRETLLSLMYKGSSKRDLAKYFNVSESTISKWGTYYGICFNKPSDYRTLNSTQISIVIGSILGDGCIECDNILSFCHCLTQEPYLDYKLSYFEGLHNSKSYRSDNNSVRCRLKAIGKVGEYKELFYKGSDRVVPKNLVDMLSPISVAIWYLDDGCRKGKNYGVLNTCRYSLEETSLMSSALNELIGINTKVIKDRDYYLISIPCKGGSFQRFCNYIKPFVPKCMNYKITEEV